MISPFLRVYVNALAAFTPFFVTAIEMGKDLRLPDPLMIVLLLIGLVGTTGSLLSEREKEPRLRARYYASTWLVTSLCCGLIPSMGIGMLTLPFALFITVLWWLIHLR